VKPTKNQKRYCTIPFKYNEVANYFCIPFFNPQAPLLSTYECDTGDGILDDCDKGNLKTLISYYNSSFIFYCLGYFSRFRPSAVTDTFKAGFYFSNLIDLQEPGNYEISFYSFFFCPKEDCDTDDTIILSVKDEDSNFTEIYRSGVTTGRVRDREWVKEAVLFTAGTSKINVVSFSIVLFIKSVKYFLKIQFQFIRTTPIRGVQTTFGIDEITIIDYEGIQF
jgi:hypothetical protein